jgi:hypothetical protein
MKSLFLLGVLTVLAVPVVASKEGPVPRSESLSSPSSPAVSDGPFSPPTPAPSLHDSLNGEGPFSPPSPAS